MVAERTTLLVFNDPRNGADSRRGLRRQPYDLLSRRLQADRRAFELAWLSLLEPTVTGTHRA